MNLDNLSLYSWMTKVGTAEVIFFMQGGHCLLLQDKEVYTYNHVWLTVDISLSLW